MAAGKVGGDRLAQRQDAVGGGIAVLAVAKGFDRRLDDMGRRREIGLADAEVDDVAPLASTAKAFSSPMREKAGLTCSMERFLEDLGAVVPRRGERIKRGSFGW